MNKEITERFLKLRRDIKLGMEHGTVDLIDGQNFLDIYESKGL